MNHDLSHHDSESVGFWRTRYAVGMLVMGAVAAYFLLSEHRAHFLGVLPFLLLLACPLMHVFMHYGHVYGRLAITEEVEMRERFDTAFDAYAARTPRFLPSWRKAGLGVELKT